MHGPSPTHQWIEECRTAFADAVAAFDPGRPALILSHNDADGLASAAILFRAFAKTGRAAEVRVLGRGENPWSAALAAELRAADPGGLIVTDLGTRAGVLRSGTPTVIIDHHVPTGVPAGTTVISGHGVEPTPTSSLLAFWCAAGLAEVDDLLWLAALGIVGDMAENAGFAEMAEARKRYTATALREATALVNAPRRTGAGDARPALTLLIEADGPRAITGGDRPEAAALRAAREEVKTALEAGKRVAPKLRGNVALVRLDSPCQIHPLVAQSWKGRLKGNIVIAANIGYRPGWVHFACRSATGIDLIQFLREKAPPGADENYGSGHRQATGGALRPAAWNAFVEGLGFGADMKVPA